MNLQIPLQLQLQLDVNTLPKRGEAASVEIVLYVYYHVLSHVPVLLNVSVQVLHSA